MVVLSRDLWNYKHFTLIMSLALNVACSFECFSVQSSDIGDILDVSISPQHV